VNCFVGLVAISDVGRASRAEVGGTGKPSPGTLLLTRDYELDARWPACSPTSKSSFLRTDDRRSTGGSLNVLCHGRICVHAVSRDPSAAWQSQTIEPCRRTRSVRAVRRRSGAGEAATPQAGHRARTGPCSAKMLATSKRVAGRYRAEDSIRRYARRQSRTILRILNLV